MGFMELDRYCTPTIEKSKNHNRNTQACFKHAWKSFFLEK